MKQSEFIAKVLTDPDNTVFTTKEQVEVALAIFQSLGMEPPQLPNVSSYDLAMGGNYNKWENEC